MSVLNFKLVEGGGDVVDRLTKLRDWAVLGEIEGVAYVTFTTEQLRDQTAGLVGFAHRDDMLFPHSRAIAATFELLAYLRKLAAQPKPQ